MKAVLKLIDVDTCGGASGVIGIAETIRRKLGRDMLPIGVPLLLMLKKLFYRDA